MIDQDLISHIAGLATAAGSRAHVGNAPQDTAFPFIVIRRKGGTTPTTLRGVQLFTRTFFDVIVIAKENAEAYPIAMALKNALHAYHGSLGSTDVQSARFTSEPTDISEIEGDKATRGLAQELLIVYR